MKVQSKVEQEGGGVNICSSLQIMRLEPSTKKPSIMARKGLVGVERSEGWVMLEGLSNPRGQIWLVPEWDETRVSHCFCSPEFDLWVSSLLLLTVPGKKKVEQKKPRHNPPGCSQSFILSDNSHCRIKSFNPHSLCCLTHTSEWKSWHLSWFFTASWSIFLIRCCGEEGVTKDVQIIDLVVVIGNRKTTADYKSPWSSISSLFHVQTVNTSLLLPLNYIITILLKAFLPLMSMCNGWSDRADTLERLQNL